MTSRLTARPNRCRKPPVSAVIPVREGAGAVRLNLGMSFAAGKGNLSAMEAMEGIHYSAFNKKTGGTNKAPKAQTQGQTPC